MDGFKQRKDSMKSEEVLFTGKDKKEESGYSTFVLPDENWKEKEKYDDKKKDLIYEAPKNIIHIHNDVIKDDNKSEKGKLFLPDISENLSVMSEEEEEEKTEKKTEEKLSSNRKKDGQNLRTKRDILDYERRTGDYETYGIAFDLEHCRIHETDSSDMRRIRIVLKNISRQRKRSKKMVKLMVMKPRAVYMTRTTSVWSQETGSEHYMMRFGRPSPGMTAGSNFISAEGQGSALIR